MSNINSLESRLYNADFNNLKELEAIKKDAKSQLKGDLSFENRTFILNTILVVNEVIMNTTLSGLPEGDQTREVYEKALLSSVNYLSNVSTKDKNLLKTDFQKSMYSVKEAWSSLKNDDQNKTKSLLNDLELYGTSALTASVNLTENIQAKLKSLDPSIRMLSTTGDGNCFYNAISTEDWLLQNQDKPVEKEKKHEENHIELRQKTTAHMKKLGVSEALIKNHSEDRFWATDEQIQYLAGAEDKPILVLSLNPYNNGELAGSIYSKDGKAPKADELRVIVNIENVHFNALYTTREAREKLITMYSIIPVE